MKQSEPEIEICFCPKCENESFEVQIERSGQYCDREQGTIYWFAGDGKCYECGFEDYYSDSN